jgi:hypothetical protein
MQLPFYYNLLDINDFKNILLDLPLFNEILIPINIITKKGKQYKIIKYNKDILSNDIIKSYGLIRSVIINSDNRIVSFAPPKSLPLSNFCKLYPDLYDKKIVVEEMIEGTMVNVFWDPSLGVCGGWEIATRNSVGAYIVTYDSQTINSIFINTCIQNKIDINFLNKEYCYSFVLQHPSINIIPSIESKLYLVEVYNIIQTDTHVLINPIPLSIVKYNILYNFNIESTILYPKTYTVTNENTYKNIIYKYASYNTSYSSMGIVIKNMETGERCKILNPNYLKIKELKVDNIKLFYQYLYLRYNNNIKNHLKLYPYHQKIFSKFRNSLHEFTQNLLDCYIKCYVKKEITINEIYNPYILHVKQLHNMYINELRPHKLNINNTVVINYVNHLLPSQQLYGILYTYRQYYNDKKRLEG